MAHKSTVKDMTSGPIVRQIISFALPLMLGNVFQMLYNTVDSVVVGNFVGTEALAAVGSTTMISNMLVFFFSGFSIGASVVIGYHFGAKNYDMLHRAVETAMAATLLLCILFTGVGLLAVKPMLRMMDTPEDVFPQAVIYLRIYIGGISGLLIYNIGSGILRAVGDSTRPLYFLILTSVLNIFLDLAFVLVLHQGIAGVAYATIISQFISAVLIVLLLSRSKDVYHLSWHDLRIDSGILRRIFAVGLPAGIQSVVTAFSNIFVQSYINAFGSVCMAGWSAYNKLDQFVMLPMQSMAMAATSFVSQNIGAGEEKRADKGTFASVISTVIITGVISTALYLFAAQTIALFTNDSGVVDYGVLFVRQNIFFLLLNCVVHVLAGALRGRGDSRGPMVIMLVGYVAIRQIYLFFITRFVANTPSIVAYGYPIGWVAACSIEIAYFFIRRSHAQKTALTDN